jgi:hypothetical protein
VAAGVSSGKTRQSLAFYIEGGFDLFIVITPGTGIRGSWAEEAENERSLAAKFIYLKNKN